ncbi:PTS ascorbate transporter subunit IIC [Companilactobacillus keshanensis]|uniref:Ascorbate-specific PTS system EIIC component n=1 Tax=Companilactobacillus keshanensis TaxID=2486003 RepID=A0ABW4BQF1_9LACO|nr:PTS ascorbate transporter subunit IIC [Companilactobacillus keshanensis]
MGIFIEIIKKPAIIIALVTLIGLIAMKNKPSKVITGTIISFVGFSMIKMGSSILADVLTAFSKLFNSAFNVEGIVPSNEAMMAMTMKDLGSIASLILVVGLVTNILVARFTRFKAVYLSLHLALFSSFAIAAVFEMIGLSNVLAIVFGGIGLGFYMAISPSLLGHYTKDVVDSEEYTIAHSGTLAYLLGSFVAKRFGNKEHDAEKVKMNDKVMFLKDPIVATTLTMFILFIVTCIFAQQAVLSKVTLGENSFIFSLENAATFAAGLYIVKAGIKMFIDEIVPAFKGFAKIFAPGSIPGVDVLVLFDKSPNTALIGFLVSFLVGVVMIVILPLLGMPVIVPGLMACFITGGASAILGNAEGGIRGAVISSAIDGLLLSIMPAVSLALFSTLGVHGTTFADPDMIGLAGLFWLIFRWF